MCDKRLDINIFLGVELFCGNAHFERLHGVRRNMCSLPLELLAITKADGYSTGIG